MPKQGSNGGQESIAPPLELSPGVWLIPHLNPAFVMSNSYLIVEEKITMLDCGYHPNQREALVQQLEVIGCRLDDIVQVLYTHHHIDHTGGGVLLSHEIPLHHRISCTISGMMRGADDVYDPIRNVPGRVFHDYPDLDRFITAEQKEAVVEWYLRSNPFLGTMEGSVAGLREGEVVNLGSRILQVITAPGHSAHDVMFFEPKNGLLFCGDSLITSGTSFNYLDGGDIPSFLRSLEKIRKLDTRVKDIYPGHGKPIYVGLNRVIDKSRKEIADSCERIVQCLVGGRSLCAVDIFMEINGTGKENWMASFCTHASYMKFLLGSGRIVETTGRPGHFSIAG